MKSYKFSRNEKIEGSGFSQNNNKRQVMDSHITLMKSYRFSRNEKKRLQILT